MEPATELSPLQGSVTLSATAIWARVLTSIVTVAEGYDLGVINGAIVLIQQDMHLTTSQVAVVVAVFAVVMCPCSLICGVVADGVGRKPVICLSTILLVVGNAIWAMASNYTMMVAGRAILGAGVGFGLPSVAIYMAEVVPAKHRGFYSSAEGFFINCGILSGFAAGAVFARITNGWRYMVGIGVLPAAVASIVLLTPLLPESPRYLRNAGRFADARAVMMDLFCGSEVDIEQVVKSWEQRASAPKAWTDGVYQAGVALLTSHQSMAIAGIGAAILNQISGIALLTAYSTYVLMRAGMAEHAAADATFFIGTVKWLTLLASCFYLVDRLGRRPLLITSAAGNAVAMGILALSLSFALGPECVVFGLCLFGASFAVGCGPVMYVYTPEVFDDDVRAHGVALAIFLSKVCQAVVMFAVPHLVDALGLTGVFSLFALINVGGVGFATVYCPETKGRTLDEIRDMFLHGSGDKSSSA